MPYHVRPLPPDALERHQQMLARTGAITRATLARLGVAAGHVSAADEPGERSS